jgi:hypothetical protein
MPRSYKGITYRDDVQPAGYAGIIPFELYLTLQARCPQYFMGGESDRAWLERCKKIPSLTQNTFLSATFKQQLQSAVANHLMVVAGGKPTADNPRQAPAAYKPKDADLAMAMLLEQHEASLKIPANGSIFWNGVNEIALAKLVAEWSETKQVYVSLEGSTSVQYINKRFEWGGAVERYFEHASAQLGLAATGHITAVCRFGLRNDSILTKTELPRMLNQMQTQLAQNRTPALTDITLVVFDPIGHRAPFKTFTNLEILDIMTWGRVKGANGWYINPNKPEDCKDTKVLGAFWKDGGYAKDAEGRPWLPANVQTKLQLPPDIKLYWQRRGKVAPPASVAKITSDAAKARLFDFSGQAQPHAYPGYFPKR